MRVILLTFNTLNKNHGRGGDTVALPFMCTNMKERSEYPFTAEQFNKLTEEERGAVLAVAEYLTGNTVGISDEDLSSALNLMKGSEGCVPQEEVEQQRADVIAVGIGIHEQDHFAVSQSIDIELIPCPGPQRRDQVGQFAVGHHRVERVSARRPRPDRQRSASEA